MNTQQQNRRLAVKLLLVALGMLGFSVAMIPLYDVFTQISGVNGKITQLLDEKTLAYQVDEQRNVYVDFISAVSAASDLQVTFSQSRWEVHPGAIYDVSYQLHNLAGKEIKLRTLASVSPGFAANYFGVIQCLCLETITLQAQEVKTVTLRWVINPELPAKVKNIALAQQFFNIK